MRIRLVHTLSLLLLGAVLLSVFAMGAVAAWNLRSGFNDYLGARDAERLEQFAELVGQAAEQAGGADALLQRRLQMRVLLDRFAVRQGIGPERERDGPPPGRPQPRASDGPGPNGPGGSGPPREGFDGFGGRVAVVALDGTPLLGRPLQPLPSQAGPDEAFVDRPIRVGGQVVALARMRPTGRVPDAVETRFLRSQYLGIIGVAATLLLLALASAWWMAGRWVRPLQAVQDATARIARGEFGIRLEAGTDGKRRSDEIGDVLHNINRMAEGLQRLEGARRRWLADMSHELRTPLAALRGEIEALVDGVRPLRPEAMLSLREETLRLSKLVDDLHLLALSDLQTLPCHYGDVDPASLLHSTVQRYESRAAAIGLRLDLDEPAAAPSAQVQWDGDRIEQLLSNLIENSLRYTDAPGRIVLALNRTDGQVVIEIDDTAPGVPDADLPRLFEPLYRADAARTRHRGGSGLGLAISEAIVRSHGGRIEAFASPLGGLRVCVELPADARPRP